MKLRHKFGVLALIYVGSLFANLIMTSWCIIAYFRPTITDYSAAQAQETQLELLRSLIGKIRNLNKPEHPPAAGDATYDAYSSRLSKSLHQFRSDPPGELDAPIRDQILDAGQQLQQHLLAAAESDHASLATLNGYANRMDTALTTALESLQKRRNDLVKPTAETERLVGTIMFANTIAGMVLCGLGLLLVRWWVLKPVAALRQATREISHGNFDYRVKSASDDELGQLGREVNEMSTTIIDMQARLVETERLAAAGQMVRRVAHNIRNPLAGIRGLAEATVHRVEHDEQAAENQKRIIVAIDRFEQWLRQLQRAVTPLQLEPTDVMIGDLVRDVCMVLQPMAQRRGVALLTNVDERARRVRLDGVHFEQAVVALVTNAIQASPPGESVRVDVAPSGNGAGTWRLSVEDHGDGVPADIAEKIFEPYFTTKPDGTGVGLAMANKVVLVHSGTMTLKSEPGKGARFELLMPGLLNSAD